MSRAGTPTDNPIIESLNGWMKAELILDFGISKVSNLKKALDQYVQYFNSERFAAALDYKTLIQYRTELGFWSYAFLFVSTFTWQMHSGFELVGISSYSFILNYLENPAGGKGHSAPALIAWYPS